MQLNPKIEKQMKQPTTSQGVTSLYDALLRLKVCDSSAVILWLYVDEHLFAYNYGSDQVAIVLIPD